jgi:hypothetical protein
MGLPKDAKTQQRRTTHQYKHSGPRTLSEDSKQTDAHRTKQTPSPLDTTASRQQTIQNTTENTMEGQNKNKTKTRSKLPNITEKKMKQTEQNHHSEQQHREQQPTTGMTEHRKKERKKKITKRKSNMSADGDEPFDEKRQR